MGVRMRVCVRLRARARALLSLVNCFWLCAKTMSLLVAKEVQKPKKSSNKRQRQPPAAAAAAGGCKAPAMTYGEFAAKEYGVAIAKERAVVDGQAVMRKRTFQDIAAPAPVHTIHMRLFGSEAWIWDERRAAQAVTDEDLTIEQYLLTLTAGPFKNGAPVLPPTPAAPLRGTKRVCAIAPSLDSMRLQTWMLMHTPALYTTNIVATANFGTTINALALVNRIEGASFNPRCFAAVKLRIHGATHLIFSEGLAVCTGTRSADGARIACIDAAQVLMRAGIQAQFLNFQVRNVVSKSNTGFDVDLAALARAYPINAHYVSDNFPGLVFRIARERLVLIVFKSGCCILTGVKTRCEAILAWTWLYCNVLWHFQVYGSGSLSDTEYGRRARQEESDVDQVCESVRDLTQSLVASAIEEHGTTPADQYFAALRALSQQQQQGASAKQPTEPSALDLERWLCDNELHN